MDSVKRFNLLDPKVMKVAFNLVSYINDSGIEDISDKLFLVREMILSSPCHLSEDQKQALLVIENFSELCHQLERSGNSG